MKLKIMYALIISFMMNPSICFAKSTEQQALQKLSFLIGHWQGQGTGFPEDQSQPYDVKSTVSYDLAGELIVLKHRSFRGKTPVLSLHTLIFYDKKKEAYQYHAYTKSGTRPFECQLIKKQLICYRGEDYRLIFQRTEKGQFNEYGEKLVNDQWQKTFEDKLNPTSGVIFE